MVILIDIIISNKIYIHLSGTLQAAVKLQHSKGVCWRWTLIRATPDKDLLNQWRGRGIDPTRSILCRSVDDGHNRGEPAEGMTMPHSCFCDRQRAAPRCGCEPRLRWAPQARRDKQLEQRDLSGSTAPGEDFSPPLTPAKQY